MQQSIRHWKEKESLIRNENDYSSSSQNFIDDVIQLARYKTVVFGGGIEKARKEKSKWLQLFALCTVKVRTTVATGSYTRLEQLA